MPLDTRQSILYVVALVVAGLSKKFIACVTTSMLPVEPGMFTVVVGVLLPAVSPMQIAVEPRIKR